MINKNEIVSSKFIHSDDYKIPYLLYYWEHYMYKELERVVVTKVTDFLFDRDICVRNSVLANRVLPDNHKQLYIASAIKKLWCREVLGVVYLPYDYVYVEEYQSAYTHFCVTLDGVYGFKTFNGISQWKELNYFKFLENRVGKDKAKKLLDEIVKLRCASQELLVEYEDLVDGYDNTNVQSCMKGNGSYFYPFRDYGKLVTFNLNDVEGRAILWNTVDGLPDGCEGFLDRIYPSTDHSFVLAVKNWASNNNYLTKHIQNFDSENKVLFDYKNRKGIELTLTMDIDLSDCNVPYMDTFTYYVESRTGNYLHNNYDRGYDYELIDTEGNTLNRATCDNCGDRYNEDDGYYLEGVGYVCEDCLSEYGVYCIDLQEYRLRENSYYCETNREWYYSDSDLIEVDGKYYYYEDDNVCYCCECGNYFLVTDTDYIVNRDGELVCEYCTHLYTYNEEDDEYDVKVVN